MNDKKLLAVKIYLIKTVFIFLFLLMISTVLKAQDVPLTVIGNAKGTPADLKLPQLKSILVGEKLRWNDGTKVLIALMKTNTPTGISTLKKIYNMSGNDLNKLFLALVFQGKGEAPTFFNSAAELQSYIEQTPGAIGVVESPPGNNQKTIRIDGKKSI